VRALPPRLGPLGDESVQVQVWRAAHRLRLDPVLWVNDSAYAGLGPAAGWPVVYDITDDWLLADAPPRERSRRERLEDLLLATADQVVVCSPALAASRGEVRSVHVIPNAVDAQLFSKPQPRPVDLPPAPVAVYVGTLHDERVDVELLSRLPSAWPGLSVALVGPNCLSAASQSRLEAVPGLHLLGPRPYEAVPAYLQHADVVVVPHVVTPFSESLDPIKAYECLTVGTPTLATPVPGFVGVGGCVRVADRASFERSLIQLLTTRPSPAPTVVPTWVDRAADFDAVLAMAAMAGADRPRPWPRWSPRRLLPGLASRLRLQALRLRTPNASFQDGCQVGRRVSFRVGPAGRVEVGAQSVLDTGLVAEVHGRLQVGRRVVFGHHVTLGVASSLEIGDDCLIGEMCSLRDHDHAFDDPTRPIRDQGRRVAGVRLGDDVWLGGRVTITAGVTIGTGTVVGAGSVVTRDLPAGVVAAGAPARILRERRATGPPHGASGGSDPS